MDQWIGNYRLSRIDNLLKGPENLMAVSKKAGKQFYIRAVQGVTGVGRMGADADLVGKSAILLENMGHTHNSLGETEKAEQCFEEALDRLSKGDKGNKGGLLMGLGVVKKGRGDFKGSARLLYQALKFYSSSLKNGSDGKYNKPQQLSLLPGGVKRSDPLDHWEIPLGNRTLPGEHYKAEHHFYKSVRNFWLTCGYTDAKRTLGHFSDAQQLYKQSLQLHSNFDTMDMRAIVDIIYALQQLHYGKRERTKLETEAGSEQYIDSVRRIRDRIRKQKIKVDDNIAVFYKIGAELIITGCRSSSSSSGSGSSTAAHSCRRACTALRQLRLSCWWVSHWNLILGGAWDLGAAMLRDAISYFEGTVNHQVDCSNLVRQCKDLIKVAENSRKGGGIS
eukprot:jgi/Bigna1/88987/estExt_fgenesh1_pg.C_410135